MTDTSRSLARSSHALLAAFGLLLAGTALVGCGEVKKCKKGELGCINEPPKDGKCLANLEEVDGLCVDPDDTDTRRDGGGGGRDGGSDGGRDGGTDGGGDECDCEDGELCSPDGKSCINFCDQDTPREQIKAPEGCRDYDVSPPGMLAANVACENTCLQYCRRAEIYCPGFKCDSSACKALDTTTECLERCPTMDPTCLRDGCETIRDASCEDFLCPDGFAKSCTDIRCNDSCTGGNTKDGYCDDGDPLGSTYAYCGYGTDCADCGPRRGPKPPGSALGENCVRDTGCPGFDPDFVKTKSWCLNIPGTPPTQLSCIPNCTGKVDDEDACPEGYACTGLLYDTGAPFTDPRGQQAYGCVPQLCGG